MIQPPFTAKQGLSGVWLEDSNGVTVCDFSLLINQSEAFRIAELLARSVDAYLRQVEHARNISKKAGRPPGKKPSPMALAKRKSREKLKQQKPE